MKAGFIVLNTILFISVFIAACNPSPQKTVDDLNPGKSAEMDPGTDTVLLKNARPKDAGINSAVLTEIDKIASEAIRKKAAPAIAVMVIKDSKVIVSRAYGTHTYTDPIPTKTTDIFDLASITKISATTLAAMRLYEQGKLDLDATVGTYIPEARKTNKNSIRVRDLMVHQAGLVPTIAFHLSLAPSEHQAESSAVYPTKVADHYFLRKGFYKDVMWPAMLKSPVSKPGKYVYSDLSMYFMKEIIERISHKALDKYVQDEFYTPLGMLRAGFNPLKHFPKDQIIPTEKDDKFRKTLVHGFVHDEGAALAGGVSGHAGLFASTQDLGILFQMLLNRGTYAGKRYFKPETVDMFTAKQSNASRRGLGFDRWDPKSRKGFPSKLSSPQTYGHTGYTGTCVWVDPKYRLIYIFLSNRVHPNRSEKLIQLNIRGRIQDAVYKAILSGEGQH